MARRTTCKGCKGRLHPRNKIGWCIHCAGQRVCAEDGCDRTLSRWALGPYCHSHASARRASELWRDEKFRDAKRAQVQSMRQTPEWQAAHREGMRRLFSDPEYRAQHSARLRARLVDPEFRARLRERVWSRASEIAEDRTIRMEQRFMRGLDDEALMVFCDARDEGMTMRASRDVALMDMSERGVALPRGPLVLLRVVGKRLRIEVAA